MKTEDELIKLSEYGEDNEVSNAAMKELKERFDPTYGFCPFCDYLVVKEKDCCYYKVVQSVDEGKTPF